MTKKEKTLTIRVKGTDWTIYSHTNSSYIRKHGKDSGAVTYPDDKEVHFNKHHFNTGYVRHEVFHVFVASSNTDSVNLNADQREELCCSIYQEHGPEMDLIVDTIVNFVLKNS